MAFKSLFGNNQKNRRVISAISLVIILLITALLVLYVGEQEKNSSVIPSPLEALYLESGETIIQEIISDEIALSDICITFGTYARKNQGTLRVNLYENEEIVESWEKSASDLIDNAPCYFSLTSPLYMDVDNNYQFDVTYIYEGDANAIALWMCENDEKVACYNGDQIYSLDIVHGYTYQNRGVDVPDGFIVFVAVLFVVVVAYYLFSLWLGEEKQNNLKCVAHSIFEIKIVGFLSVIIISKLTQTMFFPYREISTGMHVYFLSYFAMGIHMMLLVISYVVGCDKFFRAYVLSVLVCLFGFCVGRFTQNINILYDIVYYITIFSNTCLFFYFAFDLTLKRSLVGCGTYIRNHWKNIAACLVAVGFGLVFEVVRAAHAGEEVFWMKAFFFSSICLCITECAFLYQKKECFVERAVLCVLLTLGINMALTLPFSTLITWDDETHFHNVIQLVQGMNWTEADASMIYQEFWSRGGDTASFSQLADYFVALNERGKIVYFEPFRTYFVDMHQAIAYIPHCIGMWIGQVLNLQFGYVFYAGRIASAVFYALIIYAAMKRLNGGKLLVAAIALLPTNLFQATNYSYDPWLVCLAIYSVALYIGYLQEEDKLLDVKEALYVTSVMMLAIAPKGVYFPLLALFLFAPNIKFMNAKQHKRYLLSVIAMVVLCFSVYMLLPFLGGSHSGDTRFGSEISSSGQILYILTNPMAYLKTFWGFFKEYVSLSGSFGWTSFMAYLGGKDFHVILCMLLIFVALLDRGEKDRVYNTLWCKAGGLLTSFAAAAVVVTIMYCACSPVGADYIDGCQPRYLAPIIFPVLIMCVNFGYFVPKNRERFSAVFLALSGYVASAAIWFNIICRYVP